MNPLINWLSATKELIYYPAVLMKEFLWNGLIKDVFPQMLNEETFINIVLPFGFVSIYVWVIPLLFGKIYMGPFLQSDLMFAIFIYAVAPWVTIIELLWMFFKNLLPANISNDKFRDFLMPFTLVPIYWCGVPFLTTVLGTALLAFAIDRLFGRQIIYDYYHYGFIPVAMSLIYIIVTNIQKSLYG